MPKSNKTKSVDIRSLTEDAEQRISDKFAEAESQIEHRRQAMEQNVMGQVTKNGDLAVHFSKRKLEEISKIATKSQKRLKQLPSFEKTIKSIEGKVTVVNTGLNEIGKFLAKHEKELETDIAKLEN
jgi:hypothetical protein